MKIIYPIPSLLFLFLILPAQAKELKERVEELEGKIEKMQSTEIDRNARLAEIAAQVERLQTQIQSLGGGSETQGVQIQQVDSKVDRLSRDVDMRFQALEGKINLFQDMLDRAVSKMNPGLAEEGRIFQKALDAAQNGQCGEALPLFEQFLKQYPKSPSRLEALFWVADCRFALRDYKQAIKDYQRYVEQAPKSNKTPLAILNQGEAFLQLQMKEEAKVFWNKLIKDYPRSEEATQAKGKIAALEKKSSSAETVKTGGVSKEPNEY